jgi:hypothetical protein
MPQVVRIVIPGMQHKVTRRGNWREAQAISAGYGQRPHIGLKHSLAAFS